MKGKRAGGAGKVEEIVGGRGRTDELFGLVLERGPLGNCFILFRWTQRSTGISSMGSK